MIHSITINDLMGLKEAVSLADVRTPAEFEHGHIPGAFNLPLFSDEERISIGITYKQVGKEAAILLGFDLTGPKWSSFIKHALEMSPNKKIAVHCWRGGMRSGAMAWALDLYGFDVYRIEGGYKQYRRWVLDQFEATYSLYVLGGMTGSGKTKILCELRALGQQVIDLEELAQHRGSSFGSMNKLVQPTQEQFENNLASELYKRDKQRRIWVEDESSSIGKRTIPRPFWDQMVTSFLVDIKVSEEQRIDALMREYGSLDTDFLIECTERIRKRLGLDQAKKAISAIRENKIADFIRAVLIYYDKTYRTSLASRDTGRILTVNIESADETLNAREILRAIHAVHPDNYTYSQMIEMKEFKLTQYSHGAGCGCKISPAILDKILHSNIAAPVDARLLVGNDKRDDAAVLDLGNGTALISTTDFFMPIVDDPYDFGRIASANAISDVYAMGGKPVLAIAILGWPIEKLPPEIARRVLEGARTICAEAGITLAGGHSIDCPEPVFGLAVNGLVNTRQVKQNSTATDGCRLYLTKALGVGILSTAQKKGILLADDAAIALQSMTKLNKLGEIFGKLDYIKSMTDVTGFGLLGHLTEMCEGSGLLAVIEYKKVPVIASVLHYLSQNCIPGGTQRNWNSYGQKVSVLSNEQRAVLADPQTSGGLLVAVAEEGVSDFENLLQEYNLPADQRMPFGFLKPQDGGPLISVI